MLEINLASRVYIDNRKLTIILSLCGVVAVVLIAFNASLLFVQYQELSQIKSSIANGFDKIKKGTRQVSDKEYQQLQEKISFANRMLQHNGNYWLLMLDRFEQVLPEGVMLTSIDPDMKTDSIKVSGVALNFNKVRNIYETMGSSTLFKDVFLVSQSRVKIGDQQQGVTFMLNVKVVQ
jgi:type IV pilus assembly protein PilN